MQHVDGGLAALERRMALAAFSGRTTEPTLADLLRDPMTKAVMAADRVEYRDLEALLQAKRAQPGISRW